jgi:hypothetical protein
MKQRKNITIDKQIWEKGKIQAKSFGLSFSAYIQALIISDINIKRGKL